MSTITAGQPRANRVMEICNMVISGSNIPSNWEMSTFVPIYKGKGNPLVFISCGMWNENFGKGSGEKANR